MAVPQNQGPTGDRECREFGVVVLGPTGYQGHRVVAELLALLGASSFRLGAAGRDAARITAALQALGAAERFSVLGGCDASDAAAMQQLARRTCVLVSCCGDFCRTGPAVVAACVAQGTHYLDASLGCQMESVGQLWQQLRREHHRAAEASGALVLCALGFDAVTADFGALLAARRFMPPSLPHSVQSYLTLRAPKGYVLRTATYLQHARPIAVPALALQHSSQSSGGGRGTTGSSMGKDEQLLEASYAAPPPKGLEAPVAYCRELRGWAVRGAAYEAAVVQQTQAQLLQLAGNGAQRGSAALQAVQRAVQKAVHGTHAVVEGSFQAFYYSARLTVPSLLFALLYLLEHYVVWLAAWRWPLPWRNSSGGFGGGRSWGLSAIMSSTPVVALLTALGLLTRDSERFEESEQAKRFSKAFVGRGFASRAEAARPGAAPRVVHTVTVAGPSPGYVVTPASLALAAAVLLEESPRVPCAGGFTTPVVALGGTSFWDRLQARCGLRVSEGKGEGLRVRDSR